MRMFLEDGGKQLIDDEPAFVERTEFDITPGGHDFERREDGRHVPTRITLRILVAGGKIETAIAIELTQQVFKTFFEWNGRSAACDCNSSGRVVSEFGQ